MYSSYLKKTIPFRCKVLEPRCAHRVRRTQTVLVTPVFFPLWQVRTPALKTGCGCFRGLFQVYLLTYLARFSWRFNAAVGSSFLCLFQAHAKLHAHVSIITTGCGSSQRKSNVALWVSSSPSFCFGYVLTHRQMSLLDVQQHNYFKSFINASTAFPICVPATFRFSDVTWPTGLFSSSTTLFQSFCADESRSLYSEPETLITLLLMSRIYIYLVEVDAPHFSESRHKAVKIQFI